MGKFSKIFHHIETKDLRNKHDQKKAAKIQEEKKKKEFKQYLVSTMETKKYNWRSDIDKGAALREGMTTSDVATIATPANPDEVLNDTPLDNADDFAPGARGDVADFYNATVGTSIKSSGSGSGNNGGFDIGNHLAFDGDGSTDGARWMITQPVDTTNMDHIVMSIITGNDSNGGETPDDSGEGLVLYYKTPQMNDFIPINYFPTFTGADYRGGDIGYPDEDKLFNTVDGPTFVDMTIIPVGGGTPTLQDYTKYIPSYARGENTQFLLYQFVSSGTGKDNYGVKNISYRRKTPIQVVAPLDTPEASSFIRGAEQGSTPKKRKKDVDDKLEASDEYTTAKFGNEFPGQEVRVGGEDPFKSAKIGDDVKPSPQSKDEVKKTFAASRLKSALGKPEPKPTTSPEEKLADILKTTTPKPDQPKLGKDLSTFKSEGENKRTEVAVSTAARNSVKTSPEISEMIKGMTAEQKKAAIEKMYPEKAQEILDAADNNVIKSALEQGISAAVVDSIADITQPVIGAKTPANAFNEYNDFLGKVAKDPNTPGATYENPVNMSNQIEKGDMNDLTTTINSGNYQSIVNSIRATNDKDAQKRLKGELEAMIKDTINGNFGLDNFMHNNVKVNLDHLLKTGETKLTKQYKFNYGGSAEQLENATFESNPGLFAIKKIADVLGFEYDTLGDPSAVLNTGTPTFNVGGTEVDPLGLVKIIPAIAVTFGPAVVAKLGLTNVKLHGEDSYDAPGMFYEIDVPGKYSVDKNGNPIQSEKPSAAEQIKKTVSNVLNQGKEVVSNLFSYGNEDENAPQREDFPMGRSGAKKYSDAMKLYNAAKSVSVASNKPENQGSFDGSFDADGNYIPPGFEDAIGTDEIGSSDKPETSLEKPNRDDYPNTSDGDKQYQDAMKAFESQQASKEISELSNEEAENRVFDIYEQDPDVFSALYDPLFENDPVYKEYMGIYDEMEKNATPEGQELLKQQYEALEFTLQGYATKFVDTVLVQPGAMNPFGYENTSNQALTYAGKKDAPAGVYFWGMTDREQFEIAGVDLAKYDEAEAFVEPYDISKTSKFIESQPEYIEAQAEQDRLMGIYSASSNTSKSAWAAYEAHADKYAGIEFTIFRRADGTLYDPFGFEEKKAKAEELYKAYTDAEYKAIDDMNAMLDANHKRGDIWTKIQNKIDDSFDILDGAKEKRNEYWDNYEQELRDKMDVILSKINGDYDYNEDLRALDPQMEELFNRVNRQFLNLYNNRDNILAEPPDDVPPGFPDPKTDPDAYYDPFKDEPKPNLGVGDGDELASSLSGGSYGNSYDVGGGDFRGIDQIIRMYNDPKGSEKYGDRMMKNIEQIMLDLDLVKKPQASSDPRTAYAGTGDDASTFAFDGGTNIAGNYPNASEQQILRNQLNAIKDPAAAKREQQRLLKMYGIYFPLASESGQGNSMVAHFKPRGKNLSEIMLVKKTKLQRPNQFFKEPNEFFNVNDIKPEFPDNPPPKLDPNTGKHPEYGKKAKRYGKLDPISANSMPPTGDPEIDAVVNKQKTINKIKKMARNK